MSWFFYFVNTSGMLVSIEVTEGAASEIYELSGGNGVCFLLGSDPLALTFVDSSVAAEGAWNTPNVTSFLHDHAMSNAEFVLGRPDAAPGVGAVWQIGFSDCGFQFPQVGLAATNFVMATVNATTGALVSDASGFGC